MEHTVLRYTLALQVVRRKRIMERVAGIEPALSGRKHDILPLNYTRITIYIISQKMNKCKYIKQIKCKYSKTKTL